MGEGLADKRKSSIDVAHDQHVAFGWAKKRGFGSSFQNKRRRLGIRAVILLLPRCGKHEQRT